MNIRDIMTTPAITIAGAAPVSEVARLMLEHHLSGVPVTDDQGRIVGIVTETDLVAKHAQVHLPAYLGILGGVVPIDTHGTDEEMRHVLAVKASDLMTENVPIIGPDGSIDDVASLMVEHDANPIPVVLDHQLIGMVSRSDIIRVLISEEDAPDDSPSI